MNYDEIFGDDEESKAEQSSRIEENGSKQDTESSAGKSEENALTGNTSELDESKGVENPEEKGVDEDNTKTSKPDAEKEEGEEEDSDEDESDSDSNSDEEDEVEVSLEPVTTAKLASSAARQGRTGGLQTREAMDATSKGAMVIQDSLQSNFFQNPISIGLNIKSTEELTKRAMDIFSLDLDSLEEKPWRNPGADITDYFNYGFTEETWRLYCFKQQQLRATAGNQEKIQRFDSAADKTDTKKPVPQQGVAAQLLAQGSKLKSEDVHKQGFAPIQSSTQIQSAIPSVQQQNIPLQQLPSHVQQSQHNQQHQQPFQQQSQHQQSQQQQQQQQQGQMPLPAQMNQQMMEAMMRGGGVNMGMMGMMPQMGMNVRGMPGQYQNMQYPMGMMQQQPPHMQQMGNLQKDQQGSWGHGAPNRGAEQPGDKRDRNESRRDSGERDFGRGDRADNKQGAYRNDRYDDRYDRDRKDRAIRDGKPDIKGGDGRGDRPELRGSAGSSGDNRRVDEYDKNKRQRDRDREEEERNKRRR